MQRPWVHFPVLRIKEGVNIDKGIVNDGRAPLNIIVLNCKGPELSNVSIISACQAGILARNLIGQDPHQIW